MWVEIWLVNLTLELGGRVHWCEQTGNRDTLVCTVCILSATVKISCARWLLPKTRQRGFWTLCALSGTTNLEYGKRLEVMVGQARAAPEQVVPLLPIINIELAKVDKKGKKVLDSYDELVRLNTAKAADGRDKLANNFETFKLKMFPSPLKLRHCAHLCMMCCCVVMSMG